MARYEAIADDQGNIFLERDGRTLLRLPVVVGLPSRAVCEFERVDGVSLSADRAVRLILEHVLDVFLGGSYERDTIEWVDLDARRWARAPYRSAPDGWTSVDDTWPSGIAARQTALEDAPEGVVLDEVRRIEGHRFEWTAAALSPDGAWLATAHGKKGKIWLSELATGSRTRTGSVGAQVSQLFWTGDTTLLAQTGSDAEAWHFDGDAWGALALPGTARSWIAPSPDGRRLAIADFDGEVWITSFPALRPITHFTPEHGVAAQPKFTRDDTTLYGIRWLPNGRRVVVGHQWPVIGIYDASTGECEAALVGTQHFQRDFVVAGESIMASLRMHHIDVANRRGDLRVRLPNAANYGMQSGGIARDGRVAVAECNDGSARVWRLSDGVLVARCPCARGEPIAVCGDTLVVRDPEARALVHYRLPDV